MSLNWNAFLTDEGLSVSNDQWTDSSQANDRSSGPPTASTNTTGDGYFDDNFFNPNDYLLSDLEILQPFGTTNGDGSTTDSSPEASGFALDDNDNFKAIKVETSSASQTPASISSSTRPSPQMTSRPTRPRQSSQTFLNPIYESLFPNPLDTGFVEDLTFPHGPSGTVSTSTSPVEQPVKKEPETTNKRNKGQGQPDILSACWTSPLCPNHDQNGPPPNPATCGGGCAPFLFANGDDLPNPGLDLDNLAKEVTLQDIPEGVVQIKPRQRKRTESEASSEEPSGRQFPKATPTETEDQSRNKSETPQDSPEQVPAEEEKPKTRRRLPHNQVERKYRESLNTQLESLRRVVPALKQNLRGCEGADIEDLPTPSKPSKAVVLASATAYIKQMEKDKKSLAEENEALKQRVKALQALVKCDDCQLRNYFIEMKIAQRA